MEPNEGEILKEPSDRQPERKGPLSAFLEFAGELAHVILISLAIIIPIRYFLIQPFYVKGASMEPSFYDHEYLIIDEISYRFTDPQRGDIVVFRYPNDPKQFFIKRVIGLPGERVIVRNGSVSVCPTAESDCAVLDEGLYLDGAATAGDVDAVLGGRDYFLLGDNRSASLDSRVFGPVPRDFVVGRVWLRGWPLDKLHFFHAEDFYANNQ